MMKQGGIWGTQRTRPLDWVCFSFGFEPIAMGNRGLQRGSTRCNGEDVDDSSLGQEEAMVVVSVCVCVVLRMVLLPSPLSSGKECGKKGH